ncbi:MAG: EF-hand domain-containing protein [Alphaproteobacteria bacterium]|nr:EF-hand domain-containing protein [Alphaproteobacteria bacterium]MCA0451920.1 EF-hand domain-containing protein [Pseudomonadota bacterium]
MTSISGYSSYASVSSYFQTRSTSTEESNAGASLEDLFSSIDSDGDGSVSKTELKSFADSLSSQMQSALLGAQESDGAQGAFGPPPPPPGAPPSESKSAADMMSEMDTDGDGTVSAAELKAFGEAHGPKSSERAQKAEEAFAAADTDGDGKLSSTEFETFDKTMRANHAHHERGMQAYSQAQSLTQPDFASWFSNANSSDNSSNSDDLQKQLLGLLMQA